jgi:hypothetical protein
LNNAITSRRSVHAGSLAGVNPVCEFPGASTVVTNEINTAVMIGWLVNQTVNKRGMK